jgi:hypothetical protein
MISNRAMLAGLSYWASGGLLAGVPGGRAGGPVHYALYFFFCGLGLGGGGGGGRWGGGGGGGGPPGPVHYALYESDGIL